MFNLPDNLEDLNTLSETVKNLVEALALIGAAFALWKWLVERKDRAADILLKLEQKFCEPEIMRGKQCIEQDERYELIKDRLMAVVESQIEKSNLAADSLKTKQKYELPQEKVLDDHGAIDTLLRFYVVLCGIRHARQVPDISLSTCFRFWLCHYYNPKRQEFREYVDTFYPTLKKWLAEDREDKYKFFRPKDFKWPET